MAKKKAVPKKTVETLKHDADKRKNIPTAEYQSVVKEEQQSPIRVAYERRNRDLDPQLVWRGKDEQDWSDLVVHAPPLYIQEKVHPKVLIDDLLRRSKKAQRTADPQGLLFQDLYADFNGMPDDVDKTDFYQHDQNWTNRMILGDSLQVMASLAEREGLRGKVQCIYIDPPYGIKFNSNFQWSTTSRDVKDGKADHITREPEQVKAFREWQPTVEDALKRLNTALRGHKTPFRVTTGGRQGKDVKFDAADSATLKIADTFTDSLACPRSQDFSNVPPAIINCPASHPGQKLGANWPCAWPASSSPRCAPTASATASPWVMTKHNPRLDWRGGDG